MVGIYLRALAALPPPQLAFHALLLSAGGPHSSFVTAWMLFPAMLCKMGFAVLLGKSERTCNSTGVHEAMGWPWLYMLFYVYLLFRNGLGNGGTLL